MLSSNGLSVEVTSAAGYRLLHPTSRRANFDGHPYEVTLAALTAEDSAIMLHAEKVADGSGASNYDNLPKSPWNGFRLRSQCATIAAEDIAGEHDLKWLADRGWNPVGSIALEQHLMTNPDHNREVVVSLIARVSDCKDKQAVDMALTKLRSQVRVRTL